MYPHDDAIAEQLREMLESNLRSKVSEYLEVDDEGKYFLIGFNVPMPEMLVARLNEHIDNGLPVDPLINFWKLAMLNPNPRAREDMFSFAMRYGFPITSKGYFVAYKAVGLKNNDSRLAEYVSSLYFKGMRQGWDLDKMYVYDDGFGNGYYYTNEDEQLEFARDEYGDETDEVTSTLKPVGTVKSLFDKLFLSTREEIRDMEAVYTDKHTRSMEIKVGVPVKQDRALCDEDPNASCSKGLHVGNEHYVNGFRYGDDIVLLCLVNPMNVVAVPNHDADKMRTCEYFPYGAAQVEDGKIVPINDVLFESDYAAIEAEEIEGKLAEQAFTRVREVLGEEAIRQIINSRLVKL